MSYKDKNKQKEYQKKYHKKWYQKNKSWRKQQLDRYNANRRKEFRDKVSKILLDNGCFVCGYKKCYTSLCFHHIDPKMKLHAVSDMLSTGMSWQKIQEEINKCTILCANCHGEVHQGVIEL